MFVMASGCVRGSRVVSRHFTRRAAYVAAAKHLQALADWKWMKHVKVVPVRGLRRWAVVERDRKIVTL